MKCRDIPAAVRAITCGKARLASTHAGPDRKSETMWIDDFVACFDKDNAAQLEIEKAYAIKDRNIPSNKFRGFDEKGYSLQNLQDDTVWLNSPANYNDPFDCAATISAKTILAAAVKNRLDDIPGLDKLYKLIPDDEIEALKEADDPMRAMCERVMASDGRLTPEQIAAGLDGMIGSLEKMLEESFRGLIQHIRDGIKICSFSATCDPILMWSHYARDHQGFCVEYDLSALSESDFRRRMLFPVIYRNDLFDCTKFLVGAVKNQAQFNNIFATLQALYKAPDWQYEREWRLVFIAGIIEKERDYGMPKPSAVYLGAKIKDPDRTKITGICKSREIACYEMSLRPTSFELDRKLLTL